jgi:hypothetical protein
MSSLPANWDTTRISVDPMTLDSVYSTVNSMIVTISTELNAITNDMNGLLVSWTGNDANSSQEAADFNDDWKAMWTRLLGTQDHPEQGILNRFAAGLGTARLVYSRGERGVSDTWARWLAALEGMDVKDWHLGPDDDVLSALSEHTPPTPAAPDYTKAAPPENPVIDTAETDAITDIASLIDPADFPPPTGGGTIHSTAVDQQF